ncbi:MAG: NTP transferase domain-containing protein [Glaciimonas sp.]|nr:NTP transferase domain-containing protein [Glaciimonas sp.]
MIFGEFRIEQSEGLTLAHTIALGQRTLRKGRVLDGADIAALQQAGVEIVLGARLESEDISENVAAGAIASLLVGAGTVTREPRTGRCNLHAVGPGLVLVDAEGIARLNRLDEAITVATLAPFTVVRKGQVIASVKIMPFAVARTMIERCRKQMSVAPLSVAPLQPHRAALILSELPGMKESMLRNTATVTRNRLQLLGSRLSLEMRCTHRTAELASALRQTLAAGCDLVLICGATVSKDRADVVPAAIVAAGGEIVHFGMPVEPGNMLLLASVSDVPVVILPGCARSSRLNGLDWVLHRLLAKLPVTREDMMGMGVGGLIRSAPGGDEEEEEDAIALSQAETGPRIAALILAAGRSSRMDGANKLLQNVGGVPMVRRVVNAARAARTCSVTVVTGFEAEQVEAIAAAPGVTFVHNPDHAQGMSTSLRRGIAVLPQDVDGVVVLLGDMPQVSAVHIDALIAAFDAVNSVIVAPVNEGRRGNPVLWPRRHFAAMQAIDGDQGARALLATHADQIVGVEMATDAIFADVDTAQDLKAISSLT